MAAIFELSKQYGFKIIEDASHAIGGKYKNEPIGSCRFSDITVFSFHPVKIITTGEGGMAMTNDVKLANQMRLLRSHGITREANEMTHASDGPWYYQQINLGFNYRITDIQAALGFSQMLRLDEIVVKRHLIAKRYDRLLADLPVITPWQHTDSYSGMHLYVIGLKLEMISHTHLDIFESLRAADIGVNLHYIPVHLQPYYQNMGFKVGDFPLAEQYYKNVMSLPLFPTLTDDQQDRVVAALKQLLTNTH